MVRMRRAKAPKEKKPKPVNLKLVERTNAGRIVEPYKILEALVNEFFSDLKDARFAIAWNYAPPREDGDGMVKMYAVKKGSDLDRNRELKPFDFVIIWSHAIWNQRLSDDERIAGMHEALCHCAVVKDKNGDTVTDEMGLSVYRLRKPTVRTFPENVSKFGSWRPEVAKLVERAADFKDSHRPLFNGINDKQAEKPKGSKFSEPAMNNGANGKAKGKRGRAATK